MYALVDCNNFFVSCERVFNPSLNNRPVIVLSSNDGCVIARSNEAKAAGIPMGIPVFKVRQVIEKGKFSVFSANHVLYGDMSRRVMQLLSRFSSELEVYSIDEAFLSLDGIKHDELESYARHVRETILKQIGIPVSIGIAPTKTLAKIASHIAKKGSVFRGACLLDKGDMLRDALRFTPIHEVWGIGRRTAPLLQEKGIVTAYDFSRLPQTWVKKILTVEGEKTWMELNGKPCISLDIQSPDKKSITSSRSFGDMVTTFDNLSEAVATFTSHCAARLRRQKSCAGTLLVYIQSNRFRTEMEQYVNSFQVELPVPTNSDMELVHYANLSLRRIYRDGIAYKRAGVVVSRIVPEENIQMNLFDEVDRARHRKLMDAVDTINRKMGRDQVKLAARGIVSRWKPHNEYLSPCYTTNFKDILRVKADEGLPLKKEY